MLKFLHIVREDITVITNADLLLKKNNSAFNCHDSINKAANNKKKVSNDESIGNHNPWQTKFTFSFYLLSFLNLR